MKRLAACFALFLTALCFALTASAADSAIHSVTIDENAATVSVTARTDCALWGAVYDASGKMIAVNSVNARGAADAQTLALSFSDVIPSNAYAKAFLLDKENFSPLTSCGDTYNDNAPVYTEDVYAIVYADGVMVIQHGDTPQPGRNVKNTYEVDINSPFSFSAWASEKEFIKQIEFADKIQPTSTQFWFSGCSNLREIRNLHYLDTSIVTNMRNMFSGCGALTALDVSAFNTANVTNMSKMFDGCVSLTALDLGAFNTANVTDMNLMFSNCSSLITLDLSAFNTANVTDMSGMFQFCSSLTSLDVSSFDTGTVTRMEDMFHWCIALTTLDVGFFNTSNVTNMSEMFAACQALKTLNLSSFDTANVNYMTSMFNGCSKLTAIYTSPKFVAHQLTSIRGSSLFYNCTALVGGSGTIYNRSHIDSDYARIDGGASNPGYFTAKT